MKAEATLHGSKLLEGPNAMGNARALMEIKRSEGARFVCCVSEGEAGEDGAGEERREAEPRPS